ncbi:MAG: CarD family transcriptional regulator [Oligoflexia bacterium]|nr:CarD family transcriptional regulator [Oligoflexia bacterium]MBF0367426.1 CarD family transcriptional regulator [Oligoflexia bacterium]
MFFIGDFAVCPGHGVGQICDIEEKQIGCETKTFYIIKLTTNGLKIMVPVDNKGGLRKLANENDIASVFSLLSNHNVDIDTSTWNRRYRDYMEKIKTGSLIEIADVLRSLFLLRHKKGLSFGEKKMLNHCKDLLVQEISISKGNEKQVISSQIEACFLS